MLGRDWFHPVAKEFATTFPLLSELLLVKGVRLAQEYHDDIRVREDELSTQEEIIEDLRYQLAIANRNG